MVLKINGDVREIEQEKGNSGVQEWRRMVDYTARELEEKGAARAEGDADGLLDLHLHASIPCTGT